MKAKQIKLDFDLTMNDPHRGKGLHASDIYNDLYQELEPERYRKDGKPPDLLMAMGLAWEQYFEKALVANGVLCARPGELESAEGIKYSPDLLLVNGEDRIGEIKLTSLSTRVGPTNPKFAKYLTQGMIYAYWTEIPRLRYFVLHIHGNHKGAKFPAMNVWDVEFTARDLRDNYQLLMNHAKNKGMFDADAKAKTRKK
jgi:hypothetical protein